MARYVALSVFTFLAGWIEQVGDSELGAIRWSQWAALAVGTSTAALVAVGAVMNQAWEQKDQTPQKPT